MFCVILSFLSEIVTFVPQRDVFINFCQFPRKCFKTPEKLSLAAGGSF